MPMPKKPAEKRQRGTRTKDLGAVVALPASRAVELLGAADESWTEVARRGWVEFAASPLAGQVKVTDVPALRRLFEYRSRRDRAAAAFDADPTSVGSTGQPTLSPWAAELHRLEGVIEKLEDRFGLTPLGRLRLGVVMEEGVSLAARNAQSLEAFRRTQTG